MNELQYKIQMNRMCRRRRRRRGWVVCNTNTYNAKNASERERNGTERKEGVVDDARAENSTPRKRGWG